MSELIRNTRGAVRMSIRHSTRAPAPARSRAFAVGAVLALAFGGSACGPTPDAATVRVAVSVPPLAGLVEALAVGPVAVTVLIPPGGNPVSHEPSIASVRAAEEADVYVAVGHPAFVWERAWLSQLLRPSRPTVVSVANGCESLDDDPHVWLSLACVRRAAEYIAAALQAASGAEPEVVERRLAAFSDTLDVLAAEADSRLGPHRGGSFLALHPAWGYPAQTHGLDQISILEHGSGDVGPARLSDVVSRARTLGIRTVVAQPQFSSAPAALVAKELDGEVVLLDPLHREWVEAYRESVRVLASAVRP